MSDAMDACPVLVGLEEREGACYVTLEGPAGHVAMGPIGTEERGTAFLNLTQGMLENFMKVVGIAYLTSEIGDN